MNECQPLTSPQPAMRGSWLRKLIGSNNMQTKSNINSAKPGTAAAGALGGINLSTKLAFSIKYTYL